METGIEGVGPDDNWSAMIFTRVLPGSEPLTRDQLLGWTGLSTGQHIPLGHVFIIERHKRDPVWKMPAGHKQENEKPLGTAMRELAGETGIRLPPEAFSYCRKWRRESNYNGQYRWWWDLLFVALMRESDCQWMNQLHDQNEGEEPKYFTTAEFWDLVRTQNFMPKHYRMLADSALVLPMGRDVNKIGRQQTS